MTFSIHIVMSEESFPPDKDPWDDVTEVDFSDGKEETSHFSIVEDVPAEKEIEHEEIEQEEIEESSSEEYVSDVERIPWKEYIRSQFRKLGAFALMLIILAWIINLSAIINSDREAVNPENIISINTSSNLILVLLSVILFFAVLFAFSKAVLVDHKEEFGIKQWKGPRGIVTFLLTSSFISLVFILLDVALINVYLLLSPTWVIWKANLLLGGSDGLIPAIPTGTDRVAYGTIRGIMFTGLLLFVFLFPVGMFITILTSLGRKTIKERKEKDKKYYWKRIIVFLLGIPPIEVVLLTINNSIQASNIAVLPVVIIIIMVILGLIWVGSVLLTLINIIRLATVFAFTNLLLILPFIFLFYIIPGMLWGIWDLLQIVVYSTLDNTIYTSLASYTVDIDPANTSIASLSILDLVSFYLQTVWLNLGDVIRIIELDFIIIVGLGALVIGFAEGYSILSILKSISRGVSIAKTGRVAARSSPRIIVISTRLVYLFAWLSILWDKLLIITTNLIDKLSIPIPSIDFPPVFTIIYSFSIDLLSISDFFLVLTILIVPFYFIITSSFKFLSVGLVLDRTDENVTNYILLISSAFILIVTNILADVSALPPFLAEQKPFLPLIGLTDNLNIIPFVANIFDILESVSFYIGVIATIIFTIKSRVKKDD